MNSLKTVKLKANEDSPVIFMGEPSYRKGDVVYGVIDSDTEVIYASFRWGNQFISKLDGAFSMEIQSTSRFNNINNIHTYLKTLDLERWIKDNVLDKYEIVTLYPEAAMQLANHVRGNGGTEYISPGMSLLAVRNIAEGHDYITQIRKGSMFYIDGESKPFKVQALELEALSYEVLKEIKYIIDNDYKYGGNANA